MKTTTRKQNQTRQERAKSIVLVHQIIFERHVN